jgi:hypothetical protein
MSTSVLIEGIHRSDGEQRSDACVCGIGPMANACQAARGTARWCIADAPHGLLLADKVTQRSASEY